MVCPQCDVENAPTRKFCRACGSALAPVCAACGTRNEVGDRFCGECGTALSTSASTPSPAPAPVSVPTGSLTSSTEPASPGPAAPLEAEERRLVTALFADLVGYTALSERLDSEDVREIVTECLRRLVVEIERYEGTVDKFMGDAVLAYWGAPVAHEDDAARALRAALGMQRAVDDYNEQLEARRGFRLGLRIGVQSGEVVAGPRLMGGIREYSVNGDAINVASRLQGAAAPGMVLVGEATGRLAGQGFSFRAVEPLALKNKEQPVGAAVLLGLAETADEVQRAPLVGRADELRTLEGCLAALRRGRGQVSIVLGEPGLGKSRLLAELRDRVDASGDGPSWVRCAAYAHEQGQSYGLTRTLVRGLLGLGVDADETATAERLSGALEPSGASYPILAQLLGLPAGGLAGRLDGLTPQELQRRVFEAVAELLERRAQTGALVVELDDLHWADPSSVDLLLELLRLAERRAVWFCCAARPERDTPAWELRERVAREYPHRYVEVSLRPLSEAASAELVARLLHLDTLPAGLRAVLERAAGTPLWVEELVRTLVERGLLVAEGNGWRVTADLERTELPTSLQALIVARIDRLGAARPLLQTASVIGRRFGRRVLERVAGGADLDQHLLRAQRVDLVRELAVIPEREYGFKHVLTQEAAYSTLLVRRRRELHRQVADALEELYAERLGELRPLLAHHYERAEAWEQTLVHARAAADTARAGYANREAVAHYGQALRAADRLELPPTELLALREARAGVHEILGAFEAAREDYEAALSLATTAGHQAARARLLGALGMLWGGHKDYRRGLELTQAAAEAAATSGDRLALAEARVRVGVMRLNLAQMDGSQRELEAALALFRDLGDEPGQARTLDVLNMVTLCAGSYARSVVYGREAIERLRMLGDRPLELSTTMAVGMSLGFLGQRAEAEQQLRGTLEAVTEMGARAGEAFLHLNLAELLEMYGDYERGLQEAEQGLRIAREIEHREWMAGSLSVLGRLRRVCGDPAAARHLHEAMLETARELGTVLWIADALGELGQDLLVAGDGPAAATLLAEAVATGGEAYKFTARPLLARLEQTFREDRWTEALAEARRLQEILADFRVLVLDAQRLEGEALAALGQTDQADVVLRQAKAGASTLGATPARWRAGLALAELLERLGRGDEATAERAEALALLEATAAQLSNPELRDRFCQTVPFQRARR